MRSLKQFATSRTRRSGGALLPIAAVALSAIALSGCIGSGYGYITQHNPDSTTLYFKLPSQWKTLGFGNIAQAQNGHLTRTQVTQIASAQHVNWLVAFSAGSSFKPKQASAFGSAFPMGLSYSYELNANEHSAWNLASMRSVILGQDPLAQAPNDVLNYHEFVSPGGLRGTNLLLDVPHTGGPTVTFDQVTMVDPQTDWVYVLSIGCKASCWAPNSGLINQIVKSWTVKEKK